MFTLVTRRRCLHIVSGSVVKTLIPFLMCKVSHGVLGLVRDIGVGFD